MKMSAPQHVEVAIVGGGLVGSASAEAVARQGMSCLHLAPPAPPDRRTSALMQPSSDLLRNLGLFDDPAELGTPLTRIRIIDATNRLVRAPETLFDSAEANLQAFGWNFPNIALAAKLTELADEHANLQRVEAAAEDIARTHVGWRIGLSDGTNITTDLLVGADGKNSFVRQHAGIGVREHKFSQSALVANLNLGRPLDGESVEFHYPNGPFTLVPAGENRANLVWIDQQDVLEAARALPDTELEQVLTSKAMRLFGPLKLASKSFVFPLSSLVATELAASGLVLVGEAAHAFPPIGAQGLNLGLRDVAALADAVAGRNTTATDWADAVSQTYTKNRDKDVGRTSQFVGALFKSLLSDFLPVQAFRAGGLWALKMSPELRRRAFQTGMGARFN